MQAHRAYRWAVPPTDETSPYRRVIIRSVPNLDEVRRKAEEGSVVNQGYLGWAYLYGRDTEIDYAEALRWLFAAAYQGRASRPFIHLGRMHAEGLGVERNMTEAIRHYKAVVKVEPRAQLALARIYSQGSGVPMDADEALKLYSAVASCDHVHPDPAVAAFAGAVTPEEIEEARAYVRERE